MGHISQNIRIRKVTSPVDIHSANHCSMPALFAISIEIFVAREAIKTLTRLLHISPAIKSLSLFFLICLRIRAPILPSRIKVSTLCIGRLISANSVHEKNPERARSTRNMKIVEISIHLKKLSIFNKNFYTIYIVSLCKVNNFAYWK